LYEEKLSQSTRKYFFPAIFAIFNPRVSGHFFSHFRPPPIKFLSGSCVPTPKERSSIRRASFPEKKTFHTSICGIFVFHTAAKKIHDWRTPNKKHTQREREKRERESKMKCKVFAATTRSSRNMRQMEMEREECSEQQVQLDVKYCVCRFFFSFLFSLFSFLYLSSFGSGDDDNNRSLVTFTLKLADVARR
jgi:hypothetical protein